MNVTRGRVGALVLTLATLAPLACSDVTDVELLQIQGAGVLRGAVFLDLDGTGASSPGDRPIEDIDVVVETSAGEVVQRATSDSLGAFVIVDVPVGSYRITLDPVSLGDSLQLLGPAGSVEVAPDDTIGVVLGATFPVLKLEDALQAPQGRVVFTSGIALNSRVNFGDGQVHFKGGSAFLRALNVERAPVAPGDSVRIRGRVVTDNGRPALRDVTPFILVQQAELVFPQDLTVAQAASASGGALDAALGRIRNAEITDTSTAADGNFRFWAVGGVDSVEVVIRSFLGMNTSSIRPDTVVWLSDLTGLLSPFDDGTGQIRWRMLPRGASDVGLDTKRADVSVAIALDTVRASLGDTVEVTVVVGNAGPRPATLVQVRDTVPSALTYVSSTQTVGSYDPGTGVWDIGDMAVSASETLRIKMEVTNGTPASVPHRAESLGPTYEVDPIPGNDAVVVFLQIS